MEIVLIFLKEWHEVESRFYDISESLQWVIVKKKFILNQNIVDLIDNILFSLRHTRTIYEPVDTQYAKNLVEMSASTATPIEVFLWSKSTCIRKGKLLNWTRKTRQ